jgi:hypothetical protein
MGPAEAIPSTVNATPYWTNFSLRGGDRADAWATRGGSALAPPASRGVPRVRAAAIAMARGW